jgi:argininosuccinate lyase
VQRGVPLAELVVAHPSLGEEAAALLEPGVAVTRRTTAGGAGPRPLSVQLEHFRQRMSVDSQRITHARERQERGRSGSSKNGA